MGHALTCLTDKQAVPAGWDAHELRPGKVFANREFATPADAERAAAGALPPGTPVAWGTQAGDVGGFIVGHPGMAPAIGGLAPAHILWPDGTESVAASREEIAAALSERLDTLVRLAREAGFDDAQVETGERAMRSALIDFAAGGPVTAAMCGPLQDVCCCARVVPVAALRWDGFEDGWSNPGEPPVAERRYAAHFTREGDFQRVWREAAEEGVRAAREQRTDADVVPPTRMTAEQARALWNPDPDARARMREVHAEIAPMLLEFQQLYEHGSDAQALEAGRRLRDRVLAVLDEVDHGPTRERYRRTADHIEQVLAEVGSDR